MNRSAYVWLLLGLAGLGLWQFLTGHTALGAGLMGGAAGSAIGTFIRTRRVSRQREQGFNPYDERWQVMKERAAHAAFSTSMVLLALVVAAGFIILPPVRTDPYHILLYVLLLQVLLYILFSLYYQRKL